ncbi:MAG TPA: N-methyl-D-aspartate receptor NMDAR2C subunit [Burkholderiaceae bacterium]|nr:N-methyl-D-aspartate receptor NMDAR2C subunit [Burkholderiaceae bacterium]
MQTTPPPDFRSSWLRAWRGIGARNDGEEIHQALMARYAEPHRKYHTLQHLHECLSRFEQARGLASRAAEVEAALWFHDAIYDLKRSDNEAQSAAWARSAALQAGVAEDVSARVQALVMATRHTALPEGGDEQLVVDIDLAILGAGPARFAEYEQQIREENGHVPGWLFRPRRQAILRSFLERPRIFSTPQFHAALEDTARANLRRALDHRDGD